MGRRKKASIAYEKAIKRAAALKSIDPQLDLGNNITLAKYTLAITDAKNSIDAYNTELSVVDDLLNATKEKDRILSDWNERVLTGVATKYGKDSSQYEQAGGVRKSERKRPAVAKKSA